MGDYRRCRQKEFDARDFGCGCCGRFLDGKERKPFRRRVRARFKNLTDKQLREDEDG